MGYPDSARLHGMRIFGNLLIPRRGRFAMLIWRHILSIVQFALSRQAAVALTGGGGRRGHRRARDGDITGIAVSQHPNARGPGGELSDVSRLARTLPQGRKRGCWLVADENSRHYLPQWKKYGCPLAKPVVIG